MNRRIIVFLMAFIMLLFIAPSCSPADKTLTSDYFLWYSAYQKHGGWIYYSDLSNAQLYKIRPNGEELTEISGVKTRNFEIYKDRIYYINNDDNSRIYRINTDGTEKTDLTGDKYIPYIKAFKFYIVDDWIYFIYAKAIRKMKTDGTELTELTAFELSCFDFSISGDWIYFTARSPENMDRDHLYRMRNNGSEKTIVAQKCGHIIDYDEKWVYYTDVNGDGIYRQSLDGSQKQKVTNGGLIIKVIGEWLYFINSGESSGLYRIKTDGGEHKKISDNTLIFIDVWDNWALCEGVDYIQMIRIDDSHKTDALIREILENSLPDIKIYWYE